MTRAALLSTRAALLPSPAMSPTRRALCLAASLLAAACRRAETPPAPAREAPAPPAPPPTPEPVGWELTAFDDGFGRADARWLRLTTRGDERAELASLGPRIGCRAVPPSPIAVPDAGVATPTASVRCEGPDGPAVFHAVFASPRRLVLLRKGCAGACDDDAAFTRSDGAAAVDVDFAVAPVAAPLDTGRAPDPPPGNGATTLQAVFAQGGAVHTLAGHGVEQGVSLSLRGALWRDVRFGALGACSLAAPVPPTTPRGALIAVRCRDAGRVDTTLSAAQEQGALAVYVSRAGAAPRATWRVPLPAGVTIDAQPFAPPPPQ